MNRTDQGISRGFNFPSLLRIPILKMINYDNLIIMPNGEYYIIPKTVQQLSIPTMLFNIIFRRTLYYFSSYRLLCEACDISLLLYTPTAGPRVNSEKIVSERRGFSGNEHNRTKLYGRFGYYISLSSCVHIISQKSAEPHDSENRCGPSSPLSKVVLFPTEKYCAKPPPTILYIVLASSAQL